MRTIFMGIYLFFSLLGTLPYLVCAKLTKDKKKQYRISYYAGLFWSKPMLKVSGSKINVKGQENIPKDTAVLFVSNHQSNFDIPLLISNCNKPVGFIAKKEIEKIPIISTWITLMGSVFINRDDARQSLKAILQGTENLKFGHSMVIFPEGTRSKSDTMAEFKNGSFRPAKKANAPVLPVAINGSHRMYESTSNKKVTPANVTVTFGKPIYLSDIPEEYKKKSAQYVQNIIQDMLDQES